MHILNDVFLVGRAGFPITRTGQMIRDRFTYIDIHKEEFNKIQQNRFLSTVLYRKKGKYLPLYGDWAEQFWHWMMEKLPIALIAEDSGYDGYYIIPSTSVVIKPSVIWPKVYARQSMELLGIDPGRIFANLDSDLYIETLYIPQGIAGTSLPPAILLALREKLLAAIEHSAKDGGDQRIYISRNKALTGRRIVNEDALIEVLAPYGFKTVYMEELSLKEQIATMANATALVTPHGAAMAHTLFMPPGSLILALFAPTYIGSVMLPTIDLLKHRYYMILNDFSKVPPIYELGTDIEAPLELIKVTLKRELG